jgi:leucyl-tRNA synthetase
VDENKAFLAKPSGTKKAEPSPEEKAILHLAHKTINGVTRDIEEFHFNKAIARLYEFVNRLSAPPGAALKTPAFAAAVEILVKLLGPMTPHLADELWQILGHKALLIDEPWPEAQQKYLSENKVTIAVQVMGKLRDTLEVDPETPKADLEALALASEKVQRALGGRKVKKIIVVPGKIVNIVAP